MPAPRSRTVRGAVIVPNAEKDDGATHGVFDRRGQFLPLSRARLSGGRTSGVPVWAPPLDTLPGTHVYAGFGHSHFGHFMLESIARLWVLDQMDQRPDGLVMPTRALMYMENVLEDVLAPVAQRFCDGLNICVIRTPTQVERLILATPGFGHAEWLTATPDFRAYVAKRFQDVQPEGPERLYLSRRRLHRAPQLVDREDEIEEIMQAAGYDIFHPQQHPFEVQLQRLKAARWIVGADGSAFHVAALVAQPGTQVAIFMRRNRVEMPEYLGKQLRSFAGITPLTIDPRVRPLPKTTPAPLSVDALRTALADAGFI